MAEAGRHAWRVHLQGCDCPCVCDAAFDGVMKGAGLAVAVADNHYFTSGEDCVDTYCKGCTGQGDRKSTRLNSSH